MTQTAPKHITTTPEFRMGWPRLFKPEAFKGKGDLKFSVMMLMPITAPKQENVPTLPDLQRKFLEIAQAEWPGRDIRADIAAGRFNWPFVPGAKKQAEAAAKGQDGAVWEGMMILRADTLHKPQIVGPDKLQLLDEAAIYSGAWGYAEIAIKAYPAVGANGTDGVKGYLQFVMKSRDDERIFGRTAEQAFAGISGGVSQVDPTEGMDGGDANMNF